MRYKICYVDDLYYWIAQVIQSIPNNVEYDFFYFNRVGDIDFQKYDVVILDYFLDKDKITSEKIIHKFIWCDIISFSSEDIKNKYMLNKWATYESKKIYGVNKNIKLKNILDNILI